MTYDARPLFLFDIDGTLVLTGRAGVRGMSRAFEELYGHTAALEGVPIAGRTDKAIVSDVLRALGRDVNDDEIMRLRDAYLARLAEEIVKPASHPSCVLPGVERLLDRLAADGALPSGLLTGNFARGATIKLGHFGLFDRFAFGAFGDDHVDRSDLVPIALDAARRAGIIVEGAAQAVVIGDTPLDVECAHAHGARAVGVATGPYNTAALAAAGADLTLESLEDQEQLLRWAARR